MSQKKSPEQRKKEARRALIVLVLATALFIFSIVYYIRMEW
jgi:hypothetical protein